DIIRWSMHVGKMHRRRTTFRVLGERPTQSSTRNAVLGQEATARYNLQSSQPPPRSPSPMPTHSSPSGSLLSRASSVVQPIRSLPSRASTSRWSQPPERTESSDSGVINEPFHSFPTARTRETTIRPRGALSRPVRPFPNPLTKFVRDSAPHANIQPERYPSKPNRFSSDFLPSQAQLRSQEARPPRAPMPHSVFDADLDNSATKLADFEISPSPSQLLTRERDRPKRPGRKGEFKERGSLIHSSDSSIPASKHKSSNRWQQLERKKVRDREKKARSVEKQSVKADLYIPTTVTVGQFARLLNVRLRTLQKKMIQAGMQEDTSYNHVLTSDYAALLAEEFGRNPIINDEAAFDLHPPPPHPDPHLLPLRPPVVAIMGHVDHGKTTLLDTLRSSSVAASEAGGITQHIGAFCVPVGSSTHSSDTNAHPSTTDMTDGRLITFLDTPGHSAFSAMRARGTSVTDIVVLVVAADDGVMPQTLEVIELVNREKDRSNVGMVVAINKIDKDEADVDQTKRSLLAAGVSLEEFGGDVPCIEISGLTGRGLPDLIETDCPVVGYVLESKVQKGLGPVATVLVTRGTLVAGAPLLAGTSTCSTRRLLSPTAQPLAFAGPGTPAIVTGWKSLPAAGDEVLAGSEGDIKKAKANRLKKKDVEGVLQDAEAINAERKARRESEAINETCEQMKGKDETEEQKKLKLVVKGDVSGSVEALAGALEGIGNDLAGVDIVSTGVGDITETDVMMAKTADALIIAFSVSIPRGVQGTASQNCVTIYSSNIIYRVMDHIRERVAALLPCTYVSKVVGEATVLQLFDIHSKGNVTKKIAGCRVGNGVVEKACMARVIRDGEVIHEGPLDTLRQLKTEVTEVRKGLECGIGLKDCNNLCEGDLVQTFKLIEIPAVL
ncbi:translation initiation factor IF-2, partial [Pisolithus orientalis]|uniref:translation initiation factor IF-2 n=1 Tax=Pisolithus orientalis TaxID=936130 RepID=UPI0022253166